MIKQYTLEQTWQYCLEHWKWLTEEIQKDSALIISDLKKHWLKEYGFTKIRSSCFFCHYVGTAGCGYCPGRLIDVNFFCSNPAYNHAFRPLEFYAKLVDLNRKRNNQIINQTKRSKRQ